MTRVETIEQGAGGAMRWQCRKRSLATSSDVAGIAGQRRGLVPRLAGQIRVGSLRLIGDHLERDAGANDFAGSRAQVVGDR